MSIHFDLNLVFAIFLLSLRIGVLLILTPVFTNLTNLITIRVLFTLALSVVMVLGMSPGVPVFNMHIGNILQAAVLELVLGATLAFGVFAAFGVFSVAGKIMDIQSGFGLGSVFDPVTRASSPVFSSMLNLVALAVFFGLDGHHAIMRGLFFSFQQVAPGTGLLQLPVQAVMRQFGLMFSLALALIAPVMFGLFLVETAMALVSRVLPQMNVLVLGVLIKIVVAITIFALSTGMFLPLMSRVYASIFSFWEQVLS